MPTIKLTDKFAKSAPGPGLSTKGKNIGEQQNQIIYKDASSPLSLRVTLAGARTWCAEIWIRPTVAGGKGRQKRQSIATINDLGCDAARKVAIKVAGELLQGIDHVKTAREERAQEKKESLTLANAVFEYVKLKRRARDGLPLKPRTVHDYVSMVKERGLLADLAGKSIYNITPDDMRSVYEKNHKRSERQAVYSMQVLRATLGWHGVQVENSPLDRNTAGRDRIVLPGTAGNPTPIPAERLGAWWQAAMKLKGEMAADALRFMLLTGCRPGEVLGRKIESKMVAPGLLVQDINLDGGRATLVNTKNRSNHTIYMSNEAMDTLRPHMVNRAPGERVFDVDVRLTLQAINEQARTPGITPHDLRSTFATIAEELVSVYALKRMVNHSNSADVTGTHYIGKSETQLRNAWQTVADFITSQAAAPVKRKARRA